MPPVSTLVALADPTRCRIIEILRDGAQPVHVLAAGFDISRPAISRHLRVLKRARLISEKKAGRENVYRLHADRLLPVQRWIDDLQLAAKPNAGPKSKSAAKAKPATMVQEAALLPVMPLIQPVAKPRKPEAPPPQMGFDF
ncbi:ArsR/SmtB family transcription factor [Devosia lacusdianchii]|uniref:ArsR/SmtB family transcription factor n=1 Tax=Devosia lacusdianchii TaxID=2917991 RepID=UPI001F054F4B|nr:metalloregulator ArsR/SmtB family transcription factor [Devosia sp. JXJ CY 41]